MAIAENQVPFAEALHQAGHLQLLGEAATVSAEQIRSELLAWVADPRQQDAGCDLTDGMGVLRLALAMLGPQTAITLRPADAQVMKRCCCAGLMTLRCGPAAFRRI